MDESFQPRYNEGCEAGLLFDQPLRRIAVATEKTTDGLKILLRNDAASTCGRLLHRALYKIW